VTILFFTLGSCVEYFVRQLCPLSASILLFELLIIAYEVCVQFYTYDTFVISTKRCEKPSDNTSTVDRDAWYYMWGRFRISAAHQLILTFVKFLNQIKPWFGRCFSILTSGDDCIAGGSIYFRNKTCSFLVKHLGVWGLRWIHRIVT
jgi:hypothetical protein